MTKSHAALSGYSSSLLLAALAGWAIAVDTRMAAGVAVCILLLAVAIWASALTPMIVVCGLALPTSGWGTVLGSTRVRLPALLILACVALISLRNQNRIKGSVLPNSVPVRMIMLLAFLTLQVVFAYSGATAQRVLEFDIALAVGSIVYLCHIGSDHLLWRSLQATLIFMAAEALLGVIQFAQSRPVGMSSVLTSQAQEEATNISGYFRGIGTFYSANSLALTIAMSLPVALWQLRTNGKSLRLTNLLLIVLLVVGMLASLSRAGVISLVVVALGSTALSRDWRQVGRIVAMVAVLGTVIFAVPVLHHAVNRFTSSSTASRDQGSDTARTANTTAALRVFLNNPIVGVGLGEGTKVSAAYGGYTNLGAHNAYLDILEGGGVVLFLLLVAVLSPMRREFIAAWASGDPLALFLPLVFTYGWFESLFQGLPLTLIAIGVALCYASHRSSV